MHTLYTFLETIPDNLYFWGGRTAYDAKIASCTLTHGYAYYCKDLFFYREFFHMLGAFFVFGIYFLIEKYGNKKIANWLAVLFTLYMLFQELYLQQRFEGQMLWKAFADLAVWLFPFWVSVFFREIKEHPSFKKRHTELVTFVRANIASLSATAVDYVILIISHSFFHLRLPGAITIGVIADGITFFSIAHGWAFGPTGRTVGSEGIRYFPVWLGCLALNAFGTIYLSQFLTPYFIARVTTSLLVFFVWNYPLYRFWVFAKKEKVIGE